MNAASAIDNREIRGLTADSRAVERGFLFAALPGSRHDGRAFIAEAVGRGAVAVLAPTGTELPAGAEAAALVTDPDPRRRLALMAASFYGAQPRTVAAVTGTNGKTSVASFTRQIWRRLGLSAASLGTLGLVPARADAPHSLTTPDPVELHRCLAALAGDGIDHLVMEASSHGLDQRRLDGVRIGAAAFTNLTRDHLDYHGGMAAYLDAKRRLFAELLLPGGTAVLNADDPAAADLAATCAARGLRVLTYGVAGRELRLLNQRPTPGGQHLTLEIDGRRHEVSLLLAGTFQAANVLAALGLVLATGAQIPGTLDRALDLLGGLEGVPGRLEPIGRTPRGGEVYVDYAHTPDALHTVLQALRPHTAGRLWVVFGCGGDRDPGKRPMMGEIAARLADGVIVDDTPRSEDPAAIRRAILAAAPRAEEIGDRGEAIARAVATLSAGDVLVIAGKGHESGQTVGDRVLPFDDRDVARRSIAALTEDGAGGGGAS
jgi:UDP-N-acetylmuramoyl-L-alanyl-D-glutamate--2,6-diaminopimelate ligase